MCYGIDINNKYTGDIMNKTIFIVFVHETHVGKHFQSAHATKASAEKYIADNSLMFIYDTPEIMEVPLHG